MSHPHTLCIGASRWRKHSLCRDEGGRMRGGVREKDEGARGGRGVGGGGKGEGISEVGHICTMAVLCTLLQC